MRTFPLPLFDLEGMTQFLEAHSSSIHAVSRRGTTRGCSPGSVTFVTVISVPADAVRTCCTDRLEIRLTTPPKRGVSLLIGRKIKVATIKTHGLRLFCVQELRGSQIASVSVALLVIMPWACTYDDIGREF